MDERVLLYLKAITILLDEFELNPFDILELTKLSLDGSHPIIKGFCINYINNYHNK